MKICSSFQSLFSSRCFVLWMNYRQESLAPRASLESRTRPRDHTQSPLHPALLLSVREQGRNQAETTCGNAKGYYVIIEPFSYHHLGLCLFDE